MKRGGPLQRRTPLRQTAFRRPDTAPTRRNRPEAGPTEPPAALLRPAPGRRGTYAGATSGVPVVKEDASQSQAYQRAAKALGHCMRCGLAGCALDFCHADLGKGQGLKTDVRRGWPGCRACHEEVGRRMLKPVRRAVEFLLAALTRYEIIAAGTWPASLEVWDGSAGLL